MPDLDFELGLILSAAPFLAVALWWLTRRPDPEREHYTDPPRPTNGVPDDG